MPRIGVISDTHGLLRPQALEALRGSDHILHAGDIGDPKILVELGKIADVTAIQGNVDDETSAPGIPEIQLVELFGYSIYMLHDLKKLDLRPDVAGIAVVISGHSHKPAIEWKNGVLYFNPGSAGPRRFSLPITVGQLTVESKNIEPTIIPLSI